MRRMAGATLRNRTDQRECHHRNRKSDGERIRQTAPTHQKGSHEPGKQCPSAECGVQESRATRPHVQVVEGKNDTEQIESTDEHEIERVQCKKNPDLRVTHGHQQV
jgi:hypothetical protein